MGYQNCLCRFYYKITKNEESSGPSVWGQFSWQPFSWQRRSLGTSLNGSCWDLSAWPASGEQWAEDLPANTLPATIANCIICSLKCNTSEAVLTTTSKQNHPLLLYCPLKKTAGCPGGMLQVAVTATIHFHTAYKFDLIWLIIPLTCT